jgi:putative glycosyltransferase (TIGR04372 family)
MHRVKGLDMGEQEIRGDDKDPLAEEDQKTRERLWQAVQENPDDRKANLEIGVYCANHRRYTHLAEPYLLKALSLGEIDAGAEAALRTIGRLYKEGGKLDLSERFIRLLNQVNPTDTEALINLGDAVYLSGDLDQASDHFRAANQIQQTAAERIAAQTGKLPTRILGPLSIISQGFGELATSLDILVKCREAGWLPEFRPVLVISESLMPNKRLLDYVRDIVTVVTDEDEAADLYRRWPGCEFDTLHFPGPDGRWYYRNVVYRLAQTWWMDQNKPPVFNLKDEDRDLGFSFLHDLGMPRDAWFVTLHVREPKSFDRDLVFDPIRFRNASIEGYFPAIRAITERGGWVVRIGDPTMTPLPPMDGVIDYACTMKRQDWFDIFLLGACRFFVGMASGPVDVALAFGRPIVGTNWFPPANWPAGDQVLFVPKLLKRNQDGTILSMRQASAPPLANNEYTLPFESRELGVLENSPEEIEEAVVEMIERLDGTVIYSEEDENLVRKFIACANPYGLNVPWRPSRGFLQRRSDLLD